METASTAANALCVSDLTVAFGGVKAVDCASLTIREGETVGIVGPNGAGKSTLLSIIAGARRPTRGSVTVLGHNVFDLSQSDFARLGVGLAHQVPKPFRKMTVRENVQVAAQVIRHKRPRLAAETQALALTGLEVKADRLAGSLGLLDLKRLELARALALQPSLLLLDEVAAGLNGSDLQALIELIRACKSTVPTIVFVEHVQEMIHQLADRVLVLEWGAVIAEGTPEEVSRDEKVIASYLGTGGAITANRESPNQEAEEILLARNVTAHYGEVRALHDVSFDVRAAEIIGVFGANGAGKTTLAKTLVGAVPLNAGSLSLRGSDISSWQPHIRVRQGIALCPEGRRLFPDLTVRQNLELGRVHGGTSQGLDHALEAFPRLEALMDRRAGGLSGGEQQMVAIGRSLSSEPTILILDEMSLGLAPVVVDRLYESIETIRGWGTSIIMVEQSIHRARALADRALVLQQGAVTYWGSAGDLSDEELHKAYLGTGGTTDGLPAVGSHEGKGKR